MTSPALNGLDLGILLVVGFTLVRGAFRGMVREALGIAAVVGAYFVANAAYEGMVPGMRSFLDSPPAAAAMAYAVTFVALLLALMLLLRLGQHGLVRMITDGAANRAGGMVIGALKGALVVAVVLFVLRATPAGADRVAGSALAPLFLPLADMLGERFLDALPELPEAAVVPFGPG